MLLLHPRCHSAASVSHHPIPTPRHTQSPPGTAPLQALAAAACPAADDAAAEGAAAAAAAVALGSGAAAAQAGDIVDADAGQAAVREKIQERLSQQDKQAQRHLAERS